MMKNIFIYPNLRKDSARDILQPVCDQLRRDGVRLMLPKQMRVVPPIIEDADYMKTEDAVQFADMAVVLGGDGTMLRLAREAAQNQLPLLGINVGHVGFMTELEPAELPEMEKLFTGEFSLDSRMMLHVAVQRGGRIVYENDALNDIVIAKGTAFRVVCVGISADNEEVTQLANAIVEQQEVEISPIIITMPVVHAVSHATRAMGSSFKMASRTASEIWSHTLSGCPSVTDSDVNNFFAIRSFLLTIICLIPSASPVVFRSFRKKSRPEIPDGSFSLNLIFRFSRRNWHLANRRLPGITGSVPSASLDKGLFCCNFSLSQIMKM